MSEREDFIDRLDSPVNNAEFYRIFEKYDTVLKVHFHAHMPKILDIGPIESARIKVVDLFTAIVRALFCESLLMLTDYSSV